MKAVVTGAGGFVGKAITKALINKGYEVTSISRKNYASLDSLGVQQYQIDLSTINPDSIDGDFWEALAGAQTIFHVAAKTGYWGTKESFYTANVEATKRLLFAARRVQVPNFVFTSSPSVVFDGADAENKTEAQSKYPKQFLSYYPETKAKAEQLVLEANSDDLKTCALRPHIVWGPDDPHIFPRVIKRRKQGQTSPGGERSKQSGSYPCTKLCPRPSTGRRSARKT